MSSTEQTQLLLIKGMVSGMPQPTQDKIKSIKNQFNDIIESGGEEALLAMAMVGLEHQIEDQS